MIDRAGVADEDMDGGMAELGEPKDATTFIETCGALRFWDRELKVDLDAAAFLENADI